MKTVRFIFPLLLLPFLCSCNDKKQDQQAVGAEMHAAAEDDSTYVVEVVAADFAFGMPTEVPSGWVSFRMENKGQEVHNAIIFKYNDSVGYQDLIRYVKEGLERQEMASHQSDFNSQIETPMGGPAILSPGLTGQTTVFLEPGVYALTCWMVAEDGQYHVEKGMTRPFVVVEENSGGTKPEASVDITLEEIAIHIEDSVPAGEHVFNVDFQAVENVHLAKLEEGQQLEDLTKWMNKAQNPSPFTFLGGAEQAPVGMSSTFTAKLEPGRYALVTYGLAVNGMAEELIIPEEGAFPPTSNSPENPAVTLEVGKEDTKIEGELQPGRTMITIRNNGDEEAFFNMRKMKEGASLQQVMRYTEEVLVQQTTEPSEMEAPFYYLWSTPEPLGVGETASFNLEVKEGKYVITGPVSTKQPFAAHWRGEEMYHVLEVGQGQ